MKPFRENRTYPLDIQATAGCVESLSFLAHWHPEVEIIYVLEGFIRVGINNRIRILGKDDFAICSSRQIHFFDSRNLSSQILLAIFGPEMVDSPDGWPEGRRFTTPFICRDYMDRIDSVNGLADKIKGCMLDVKYEVENHATAYKSIIKAKLLEISAILERSIQTEESDDRSGNGELARIENMQAAIHFIERNYIKHITLSEMAKKFNYSLSHFSRLLKNAIGMNFNTFVAAKRINCAKYLLCKTEHTINEIVYECGFESVRNFNRVFKSLIGCTPSDYRNLTDNPDQYRRTFTVLDHQPLE